MNIIDSTGITMMLRAAKADAIKARRQWKLGLTLSVGAAVICLVGLGVI